jgi:hypothetical protein
LPRLESRNSRSDSNGSQRLDTGSPRERGKH